MRSDGDSVFDLFSEDVAVLTLFVLDPVLCAQVGQEKLITEKITKMGSDIQQSLFTVKHISPPFLLMNTRSAMQLKKGMPRP